MKAVVIGSGHIGCGFAGQLLRASGMEVVFAARNPLLVDHFNRLGQYRVRLVQGKEEREFVIDGVRAVSTAEPDLVAAEIAGAGLVATAVGAGNLSDIAPLIAAGLRRRTAPLNVIAFENLANAGTYLHALVTEHLPADFPVTKYGDAMAWLAGQRSKWLQELGRRFASRKAHVARRVTRRSNPNIRFDAIVGNVLDEPTARLLVDVDFLFLASDSIQSRLVFNALVHQYLIPGAQVGAKVPGDRKAGTVGDAFVATRPVLPYAGGGA
ncbi:MAG: hypothetical protein LC776_02130 [Acidobacteria bacterium]|nr:hypothetical protein [Acidobacteriota bacterium]